VYLVASSEAFLVAFLEGALVAYLAYLGAYLVAFQEGGSLDAIENEMSAAQEKAVGSLYYLAAFRVRTLEDEQCLCLDCWPQADALL